MNHHVKTSASWKEETKTGEIQNAIADRGTQFSSWKDVTDFDFPARKPRCKRHRRQMIQREEHSYEKHQESPQLQQAPRKIHASSGRKTNDSLVSYAGEFETVRPKLPKKHDWNFESLEEDFSSDDSFRDVEEDTEPNKENFYEESCKMYSKENQTENVEENLLINGFDLSDKFIKSFKSKETDIYRKMLDANDSLRKCETCPHMYKHCEIKIINPHKALCLTFDGAEEIEISGRSKCGKVFNEDHVVVEILESRENTSNISSRSTTCTKFSKSKTYGEVIGITKTNETLSKNPIFVCTLDQHTMYHMKPLCKTVPKIHVLHRKQNSQVEIYKYDERTMDLKLDRLKNIDHSKRKRYIFIVCFIEWKKIFPLGAVIGVYDGRCDIKTSLRMLCLRNHVSVLYRENTVQKVNEILNNVSDQNGDEQRTDLSESVRVFTIDEKESMDLDDALSVRRISKNEIEIGVHIADVGSFVKKNDPIDLEAQERSTTFYPGENYSPYHMLPEPLGAGICSLLPQKKRKTISIIFNMDKLGNILKWDVKRTVIQSRRRFTYFEVQQILSKAVEMDDFKEEFCILHNITKHIRHRRLGNRAFSFPFESSYNECSGSYFESLDAHIMVEECMVLANRHIGQMLIKTFPDCVPLRVQNKPSSCRVKEWLEHYPIIANFVLSLQHHILPTSTTLSFDKVPEDQLSQHVPIQNHIWKNLVSDYEKGNFKNIQKLVGTDEFHPQQAMAYESWISFQEKSSYQCSGSSHGQMHFSLGIYPYVHFTSPIRRYADLIANRLVNAVLDNAKSPYSQNEVEILCKKINRRRPREFERQCRILHWGKQLRKQPVFLHGLVKSASETSLLVCLPGFREFAKTCSDIQYHLLKVKKNPDLEEKYGRGHLLTLSWQQRLYSGLAFSSDVSNSGREPVNLNPHQKVTFLPCRKWKKLLQSVITGDMNSLQGNDFVETEVLTTVRECQGTHYDASSETNDGVIGKQYTEFSMTFSKGQILPIQIGAEEMGGMRTPVIQLLELTKNVKCCIQHMSDPVRCFATFATKHAGNGRITLSEYIQRWLNIFRMESVMNATKSISIVINDLQVGFLASERFDGSFVLLEKFCQQRDMDFRWHNEENEEDHVSYQTNFICIRCDLVNGIPSRPNNDCSPYERWVWVGHGETKLFKKVAKSGEIEVKFKLHRNSLNPTSSMTDAKSRPICAVEILQMSESDR